MYGAFGTADRVAMLAGSSVVACLGAPLLGVAAGRWLRFPGAAPVLVVAVAGWVTVAHQMTLNNPADRVSDVVRFFTPFAFFQTVGPRSAYMESWPGSPGWYVVWLLALCGLTVVAALAKLQADGNAGLAALAARVAAQRATGRPRRGR